MLNFVSVNLFSVKVYLQKPELSTVSCVCIQILGSGSIRDIIYCLKDCLYMGDYYPIRQSRHIRLVKTLVKDWLIFGFLYAINQASIQLT